MTQRRDPADGAERREPAAIAERDRYDAAELDRVCELTSIGAGHAANALAQLTGRTCEMGVPTLRRPGGHVRDPASAEGLSGVLFEFEGGPGGVLALLFPATTCARLLAALDGTAGELHSAAGRSALCEIGNILVSHAANAVGALLGVPVLPSVPRLALDDAASALTALLAGHGSGGRGPCMESEICDRAHELCGVFVFAPNRVALGCREATG